MKWTRPPVGIVRAEQEYCRWLLDQSTAVVGNVRFCVYDRAAHEFVEVPRAAVVSRLGMLGRSAVATTAAKNRWKLLLKSRLRPLLAHLAPRTVVRLRAAVGRALACAGRVRAAIRALVWRFTSAADGARRYAVPIAFGSGDRWVSLGLDWDALDQRELYCAKLRHRLRVTLICYDVIPALYPHLVVLPPGQFGAYFANLAWCADAILCISEHTRRDVEALLRRLGAPVPPTHVIRLGSEITAGEAAEHWPAHFPHTADARPFVLFVSTIERRKNHELLYRAWVRLRERGVEPYRLVFVGMPGWGVGDLMHDLRLDARVRDDIVMLDRVTDAQLATLYKGCAFTVFPSLYEGWGLPLVESLAWGKFCLASNAASLPEAGGSLVEYLDPWDLPAWVERLEHYMTDRQAVAEREARIAREFVAPRWADTAAAIHRVVISAGTDSPGDAAP